MDNISYNREFRIRLINKEGFLIELINQVEAFRLLRNGFCKLLLVKPPTIQFELETHEWDIKFKLKNRPPKWFREGSRWLEARKTNLYGNYQVVHPDGHIMFHCDVQKALWYLNRELADIISENPPQLQLKFIPGGLGHIGDKYYLTPKVNQCVVCGINQDLNRHHVMPRVFRRHLPEQIKNHNYHDILLLCVKCHCAYEVEASKFKQKICKEFGILINDGGGENYNQKIGELRGAARALLNYGNFIPEPRYSHLQAIVKKTCSNFTEKDLKKFASMNPWTVSEEKEKHVSYGLFVMQKIQAEDKVQEFTEQWRKHFVDSMKPKYLPEYWDVKRPLI